MRIPTAALFAALALALPATAVAAEPGEIGGPPTEDFSDLRKSPFKGEKGFPKAKSDAIVIGVGTTGQGRVEISAQDSNYGLCVNVDYLDAGHGSGSCPEAAPENRPISLESFSLSYSGGKARSGDIAGPTQGHVVALTMLTEHNHKRKLIPAVFAHPDAAILARLHQQPFGFFVVPFRGCVPPYKTVSIPYDANGAELGRIRGPSKKHFGNPCRPDRRHGGGIGFAPIHSSGAGVSRSAGPSLLYATPGTARTRATYRWRSGPGRAALPPPR